MGLWDQLFERLGQPVAQILLTRNDIADRTQYLNAQNTFIELLHMGVIPIVNENDTIAVSEIKFGDNDTLSAITAGMVQADYLFLMTDVDCLYDSNPRTNPDAKAIEVVENIADLTADVSSKGSALGTGGMSTKIVAARLATAAGVTTVITRSSKPGNIAEVVAYAEALKHAGSDDTSATAAADLPTPPLHTRFLPSPTPIPDRRFWLLHGLAPHGTIYIDQGAANALAGHAGLLPVGIIDVDGSFAQQECVRIVAVNNTRRKILIHPQVEAVAATEVPSPSSPSPSSSTSPGTGGSPASRVLPAVAAAGILARTPSTTTIHPPTPSAYTSGPTNREVARALVNYSAAEIRRIKGLRSSEIAGVLGYADGEYVALRENVALLSVVASRPVTPTRVSSTAVNAQRGGGVGAFSDGAGEGVSSAGGGGGLGGYVQG